MDNEFGASDHMIFRRTTFNTYEVFAPYNVYLGDDSVMSNRNEFHCC